MKTPPLLPPADSVHASASSAAPSAPGHDTASALSCPDFWVKAVMIGFFVAGLFFFLLGHRPLATPDEGRYVEIAREMVASGDFVTPHLNGLAYFEKPPLFYWMQAGLVKLFGVDNFFALRLSTVFFALLGCWMVCAFGKRFLGPQVALWSTLILGTNVLYFLLARLLILDLAFGVWMTGAMLSFFALTQAALRSQRLLYASLYGLCLAAAVLTKGLIGVVLPGLSIVLWILYTRQYALFKLAFHPVTLGVFSLVALPWHILVSLKNPEFPYFYFVHEHFLRYTTTVHRRHQPFWFFLPVLMVGFFPWSTLLPRCFQLVRRGDLKGPGYLMSYLCFWMGGVFCFFSCSSSKLIPYLVPLIPPASLVVAAGITQAPWIVAKNLPIYRAAAVVLALGVLLYVPIDTYFFKGTHTLEVLGPGLCVAACGLLAGVLGSLWARPKGPEAAFQIMALSMGIFLMSAAYLDPFVQPRPSIQPLVHKIAPVVGPETPVVTCFFYPQDLPVYLGRTVQVFGHSSELDYGASIRPGQDRLITREQFAELWQGPKAAFAVLPYRGDTPLAWYTQLQQTFPTLGFHIFALCPPYLVCTNTLAQP